MCLLDPNPLRLFVSSPASRNDTSALPDSLEFARIDLTVRPFDHHGDPVAGRDRIESARLDS